MNEPESTETYQYPELEAKVHYQLWRAANRWQRELRRELEPYGLTYVQSMALGFTRFLSQHHEHVTQAMLARTADMDEMMISQVVRTLEQRGLMQRHSHPQDARARCLQLTPEGHDLALQVREHALAANDRFLSVFDDRQKADLVQMLRTLATNGDEPTA